MTAPAQVVHFPSKRERMISELTAAKAEATALYVIAEILADSSPIPSARLNAARNTARECSSKIQGLLSGVIKDLENGK